MKIPCSGVTQVILVAFVRVPTQARHANVSILHLASKTLIGNWRLCSEGNLWPATHIRPKGRPCVCSPRPTSARCHNRFGEIPGMTPADEGYYEDIDCILSDMSNEGGQKAQQDGGQDTQHGGVDIDVELLFEDKLTQQDRKKRSGKARGVNTRRMGTRCFTSYGCIPGCSQLPPTSTHRITYMDSPFVHLVNPNERNS